MRRVKSYNGAPYVYQVHEGHAVALENVITGLVSPFGNAVILSGCILTPTGGGNVSVSSGWISWAGELFYMPSHSFYNPTNLDLVLYKAVTTINYPELNADGTTKVMIEVTEVKIKGAAAPAVGESLWTAFQRYIDVLHGFTKNNQPAWRTVPLSGSAEADKYVAPAGIGSLSPLQYKVTYDNILCIRGHFKAGQVGIGQVTLFTLPVGARPGVFFSCPALIADSLSQHFESRLFINPDGTVELKFTGTSSTDFEYTFDSQICIPL